MNEVRWKLKSYTGKVKTRTGYVLEQRCHVSGVDEPPTWEPVTIERTNETLVFDQYPLGQAVPKIMSPTYLADVEEDDE